MGKILILPLLGIIFGCLLFYFYPSLYFLSWVLIVVSIFSLVWLGRKAYARIVQLKPFTIMGYQPTILECPKCGGKLRSTPGQLPPLYACPNCGYHGPLSLKPRKRKSTKKTVQ